MKRKALTILGTVLASAALISGAGIMLTNNNNNDFVGVNTLNAVDDGNGIKQGFYIKDIAYGTYGSTIVFEDKKGVDHIYSSGLNDFGQLGTGNYMSTNTFVETDIVYGKENIAGIDGDVIALDKYGYGTSIIIEDKHSYKEDPNWEGKQHMWVWGVGAVPPKTNIRYYAPESELAHTDGWVYTNSSFWGGTVEAPLGPDGKLMVHNPWDIDFGKVYFPDYYVVNPFIEDSKGNKIYDTPVEIDLNNDGRFGTDEFGGLTNGSKYSAVWDRYTYDGKDTDRLFFYDDEENIYEAQSGSEDGFIIRDVATTKHSALVLATNKKTGATELYANNFDGNDPAGVFESFGLPAPVTPNPETSVLLYSTDESKGTASPFTGTVKSINEIAATSNAYEIWTTESNEDGSVEERIYTISPALSEVSSGEKYTGGVGNKETAGIAEVKVYPRTDITVDYDLITPNDHVSLNEAIIIDDDSTALTFSEGSIAGITTSKSSAGFIGNPDVDVTPDDEDNHVYMWGSNDYAELGRDFSTEMDAEGYTKLFESPVPFDLDTNNDNTYGTDSILYNFATSGTSSIQYHLNGTDKVSTWGLGDYGTLFEAWPAGAGEHEGDAISHLTQEEKDSIKNANAFGSGNMSSDSTSPKWSDALEEESYTSAVGCSQGFAALDKEGNIVTATEGMDQKTVDSILDGTYKEPMTWLWILISLITIIGILVLIAILIVILIKKKNNTTKA